MKSDPSRQQQQLQPGSDGPGGRAFPWLPVLMLTVGLAVAAFALWNKHNRDGRDNPSASLTPTQITALSEIPVAKFTDVTDSAGIKFVHNNGAYGDKLLPETMGGGVAFF